MIQNCKLCIERCVGNNILTVNMRGRGGGGGNIHGCEKKSPVHSHTLYTWNLEFTLKLVVVHGLNERNHNNI